MTRIYFLTVVTCLSFAVAAAPGDTLYVAERLYLSMSAEPLADSPRVRLLESGDAFEEVSRQGDFIQIRLADGTEGWVREAYVTANVPGNIRAATLQSEITQLQTRITELEAAPTEETASAVNNPDTEAENQRLRERVTVLENELQQAKKPAVIDNQTIKEPRNPITMYWAIAAAVGFIVLGGVTGFSWRSRQVRRRLHGLDI